MNDALTVILNGREREIEGVVSPARLSAVLDALAMRADRVAVELNGELAPRARWAEIEVASGYRLEIVHFVGGGGL